MPALVAVVFLVVPLVALVLATPWSSFLDDLRTPEVRAALGLSLRTSLATVGLCALVGTPLAWVLARVEFRGRGLVRALVTVPLVLPPSSRASPSSRRSGAAVSSAHPCGTRPA
ncbi:hypothetical protein [Nocardioides zeae]